MLNVPHPPGCVAPVHQFPSSGIPHKTTYSIQNFFWSYIAGFDILYYDTQNKENKTRKRRILIVFHISQHIVSLKINKSGIGYKYQILSFIFYNILLV